MLESATNPGPIEAAVQAPSEQLIAKGSKGSAPDALSLAETYHVVKGKRADTGIESLIDPAIDNRTRILETTLPPWRMICSLSIESTFGPSIPGTGWLAGPSTVITAGHCVHALERGGWATKIDVTPGQNGVDQKPYGQFQSRSFNCTKRWRDDADPDYDIGCIQLSEPIGNEVGWFGMRVLDGAELSQWHLNLSGYPLKPGQGVEQRFHSNSVHKLTDHRVYYQIDTTSGNSGGPVWIQDVAADDAPYCVAIHAYSVGDGVNANSGPRINSDVFDLIQSWVADAAG
ncbi:MAG: trypsin-like serine protease [Pseudomonadota bacterium]